jgi:hypothetical protein
MSKITNYNSFKSVTVALFAFAVLFAGSVAWSQGGGTITINPTAKRIGINSLVSIPGVGTIYHGFYSDQCNYWSAAENVISGAPFGLGPLYNKFSGKGNPLANAETGGLSYPPSVVVPHNGLSHTVPFSTSNVDAYWKYVIYGSYGQIGTASLSQNCHGYSTGVNYWLDSFQTLVNDDWTKCFLVGDLPQNGGAVYGGDGHSIRIDGVTRTWATYTVAISEKNRDSAIYTTSFSRTGNSSSEVELEMQLETGPTEPFDHFYKK